MFFRRFPFIASAVLLAATCGVYLGALWNGFVEFDDNIYVMYNTHTAAGLSLAGFRNAWTTFESGNWIPLTWLSFQLDSQLFGMRAIGFHVTNMILHAANVLLLFTWLLRVTGSQWRSAIVAAIFGLHPLHVESVAWVAERKDVLSMFWLLVCMHAYERYAVRGSAAWYLATCVTFAFGLLSKSMLVTLPVLLLLVDFWPLGRWKSTRASNAIASRYPQQSLRWLIVEKIPLFGLSLADGVITLIAASYSSAFSPFKGQSLWQRLPNVLHSYGWYIAKTFNPTKLMVIYPYPRHGLPWLEVVAATVVLVTVSIYVAINGTRRPYLVLGWMWFLISLLPVIGLLQVGLQAHADRYSYIPHIGLLILIVWEAHWWLCRFSAGRAIAASTAITITMILGWLTVYQVAVWRTSESLWKHVILVDPENSAALLELAVRNLEAGHFDEASQYIEAAVKLQPEARKQIDSLAAIYRKFYDKPAEQSQLHNELGYWYIGENIAEVARIHFDKAVSISPDNVSARFNLALALIHLGRIWEARTHLEEILRQKPSDAGANVTLGIMLEKEGKLSSARDHFKTALESSPNDEVIQIKLRDVTRRMAPR